MSPTFSAHLASCALFLGCLACSGETDPGSSVDDDGSGGSESQATGGTGDPGATGGAGTGGSGLPSGGNTGSGGAGSGGDTSSSGGNGPGSGGDTASSGGDGPGSGGAGAGGSVATAGCGAADHPLSGDYTLQSNGKTREYVLSVPANYDRNKSYPVIFGLHWRGGNSGDVVANGYYGLKERSNDSVIFVSPEGLTPGGQSGWANDGGEDVDFVAAILDRLEADLCIDTGRVFATGFSFGGMFSNAIGCGLADRFRAVAPYAGSLWSGCDAGTNPIAYFGTHGLSDKVVEIPNGRAARDEFLKRNGCSNESTPVLPSTCVSYSGCRAGYPVVWCEYEDGHWWPGFASDAVWAFFSQF